MAEEVDTGMDIEIFGKSGQPYRGRIYADKDSTTTLSGKAIVCLTNSTYADHEWKHAMNSIYNTGDVQEALNHFRIRDDISHIILIPYHSDSESKVDKVDDLIRNYIHS